MSSQNKKAWAYFDDNNVEYITAASGAITAQGGATPYVGGEAGDTTKPPLPPNLMARYALVQDAVSGAIRKVRCYKSDAPLYLGTQTTITLELDGTDTVFTWKSRRGERLPRKIGDAT